MARKTGRLLAADPARGSSASMSIAILKYETRSCSIPMSTPSPAMQLSKVASIGPASGYNVTKTLTLLFGLQRSLFF
jgi:hypothetical protein